MLKEMWEGRGREDQRWRWNLLKPQLYTKASPKQSSKFIAFNPLFALSIHQLLNLPLTSPSREREDL